MFVVRHNIGQIDLDRAYDGAICWNYDGNVGRYYLTFVPVSSKLESTKTFMDRCVSLETTCDAACADNATDNATDNADDEQSDPLPSFEYSENKGVFYVSFDPTTSPFNAPREFVDTMGISVR